MMDNTDQPKPRKKKSPVEHDPAVPKHATGFETHPTKPRKEGDEPAN